MNLQTLSDDEETEELLRRREARDRVDPGCMIRQKFVTVELRNSVVGWLWEVSVKCMLKKASCFLATQLLDRFLATRVIPRSRLQLIAATSLFVASKFEQDICSCPEPRELAQLSDDNFTADMLLRMELILLKDLRWIVSAPTPLTFFLRWVGADEERTKQLGLCLLQLALLHHDFLRWLPSQQAAGALYLAQKINHPERTLPEPDDEQVLACARRLNDIFRTQTTRETKNAVVQLYTITHKRVATLLALEGEGWSAINVT